MICKAGHTTQMKAARIKLFKKEAYFFMIRGRLYMVCKLFFRLFAIGKQGGYFYMKTLNIIALTIGIIGAVNWGLIGFLILIWSSLSSGPAGSHGSSTER